MSLVAKFLAWLSTSEGRKIFRYTMVSVISTGCSLLVLAIVFGALKLWTEVPSTIFANAVAALPSYWLNRAWAWGKTGRSHFVKEILPFWAVAAAGIAFSIIGAALVRHMSSANHFGHLTQTVLVLGANIVSFGVFWVLKLAIFNKVFHMPTLLDELDEHLESEEAEGLGRPQPV